MVFVCEELRVFSVILKDVLFFFDELVSDNIVVDEFLNIFKFDEVLDEFVDKEILIIGIIEIIFNEFDVL